MPMRPNRLPLIETVRSVCATRGLLVDFAWKRSKNAIFSPRGCRPAPRFSHHSLFSQFATFLLHLFRSGVTRSDKRPSVTSYHNARPHTYLNRGWPRSNAAQKSGLRGVTPPQTGRLRQELQRRKWRDFATSADYHQRRAAAHHAAFTWSGWRGARPNVETLQSCKRTAYPRSGKRVRNAEIATSPPRTRLPVPPRRPARLPLLATGCVGHGLTSARAKPAHTRHASGLGTRRNHPRWR